MSKDEEVTKDLISILEDGKDGFAKAAEKLDGDGAPDLAAKFREYSWQRNQFAGELRALAGAYGDDIDENGSVAGALHRSWLRLKDALSGDDPKGVLDAAEQGEDHAVAAYEKAMKADISAGLRTVLSRQSAEVGSAHQAVRSLRDAHR